MTDTLYKINSQDGTILSGDTEILLFNDSIVDTVGNAYITKVVHNKPKAVSGNQALGQDTLDQQPEGILGEFYTIHGVIPFMDGTLDATGTGATLNSTIEKLKEWSDGLDSLDGSVIHGMFGFEFLTVTPYKLTPISSGNTQIGLLWAGLEWDYDLILNIARFTLKLKVDKGDAT